MGDTKEVEGIVMFGADWCGDCRRSKRVLDRIGAAYDYVDLERSPGRTEEARRLGRSRRIPVITFPDGRVLVEPSDPELEAALAAQVRD
jgi:mycoredoxin